MQCRPVPLIPILTLSLLVPVMASEPALGAPRRQKSRVPRAAARPPAKPERKPEREPPREPPRQPELQSGPVVISFETPLYEHPGEGSRVLARLVRGAKIEIVGQDGRWLEARAGALRGWVPRSTVERSGPAPVWIGPAALLEVVRPVAVRVKPDPTAAAVFDAPPGAELRDAGERRAGWILVENSDGVVGWIPAGVLRSLPPPGGQEDAEHPVDPVTRPVAEGDVVVPVTLEAPSGPGRAAAFLSRPRWFRARGGIGLSSFNMDFSSDGHTPLAAYSLSASAMAVSGDVEVGFARRKLRVSADLGYGVTVGVPGIRTHFDEDGAADAIGFTWHTVAATGRVGYLVAEGWAPHVRAGYHYDWFRVDDVTNPGRLARDGLRGATLGAGIEGALSDEVMVRAGGDWMVAGGRKQTDGLEDGQRSSERGFWGQLEGSYLLSSGFAVEGNYQYGWASTAWNGQSSRQADVTRAARTDHSHLVLIALVRNF